MVNYEFSDLFLQNSVDKQLSIVSEDGLINITNTELHSEQFELKESISSSNELRFGGCEASVLKFRVSNVFMPMKDKWLTVKTSIGGNTSNPFEFGRYKVYSDVPTADRKYRNITAYDTMYDIVNADVSSWYNGLSFPRTLKEFRTSFASYFGLEQEEIELVNDDMIVEKTIDPERLSGKDVLFAICEINGCFGHIGRNGKLRYVVLKMTEALYPANDLYPSEDLYPRTSSATKINTSHYMSCQYEDFKANSITQLQIRKAENDIGATVGKEGNKYAIQDNFLLNGKSSEELNIIGEKTLSVMSILKYRPFTAKAIGNPCLEVGDAVRFNTKNQVIESYILERSIKGIQSLKDTYTADGTEYYSEQLNTVNKQIIDLKGKTNVLERTVEETKSTITDVEKGLQSQITQNAEEIELRVKQGDVSAEISVELGKILLKGNRIAIQSDYFTLTEDGKIKAVDGEFTGKILASGTVTKYAKDYSQSDYDRVQQILLGQVVATVGDYEKYDFDGDGIITLADQLKIKRLVDGLDSSASFNVSVLITPANTNNIIQTTDVAIGRSGVSAKVLNGQSNYGKEYWAWHESSSAYVKGASGTFTTADGKNVQVSNGLITSIL